MTKLADRIKFALDEARTLILVVHILLGFEYRGTFEKVFDNLPAASQDVKLGGLACELIALGLLMAPAAYHRIVTQGGDTEALHDFAQRAIDWALLPFALALGLDLYYGALLITGQIAGIAVGVFTALLALSVWYALGWLARARGHAHRRRVPVAAQNARREDTVRDKVDQVLTEARMVVPGAQALLGFQLASTLMEGFAKLPESSKYVHLASLGCVGLSVVLLMAPAAYHRIVEEGEATEHFHHVATRLLLAAMVPLALGICGDGFVVVRKITGSVAISVLFAAAALLFFYGLWFGYTLYIRARRPAARRISTQASRARRAG